jgi:Cu-Zn family superoxide dismutase
MAQLVQKPPAPVRRRWSPLLLALAALAVVAVAGAVAVVFAHRRTGDRPVASAVLKLADGRTAGRVDFFNAHPGVLIRARVSLPAELAGTAAFHGFHVHANDDAINGNGCLAELNQPSKTWFASADAHLDHNGHQHPGHSGDMPSVYVSADGHGYLEFDSDRLSVADLTDRAVVLHAGPDNFGRVPAGTTAQDYTANSAAAVKATQQGGNSGDRIACGLIGPPGR